MTPETVIIELFTRIAAESGASILINGEELTRWPAETVSAIKSQGLLKRARSASAVVCNGCEQECAMPVHTYPASSRKSTSFIVCDKRDDINRVPVAAERLVQWRCDTRAICEYVAASLGLRRSDQHHSDPGLLSIGMATGEKRNQMLCLRVDDDLNLVAGGSAIPLAEVICYEGNEYSIDRSAVCRLVDSATTTDPRFTPNTARREMRKLETQAIYAAWQKEYRELKRHRPKMSDMWRAQQIAKMSIGNRRSVDTIRKNMKK